MSEWLVAMRRVAAQVTEARAQRLRERLARDLYEVTEWSGCAGSSWELQPEGTARRQRHVDHAECLLARGWTQRATAERDLAVRFRREVDPSTSGTWAEACDLLDSLVREGREP